MTPGKFWLNFANHLQNIGNLVLQKLIVLTSYFSIWSSHQWLHHDWSPRLSNCAWWGLFPLSAVQGPAIGLYTMGADQPLLHCKTCIAGLRCRTLLQDYSVDQLLLHCKTALQDFIVDQPLLHCKIILNCYIVGLYWREHHRRSTIVTLQDYILQDYIATLYCNTMFEYYNEGLNCKT